MRQHGRPVLIAEAGVTRPDPAPLGEGEYDEGWLQSLLYRHPEVLPVEEIEPTFAPLVPVGMEIPCAAGSIDNLFIGPGGALTIVETKLWRNPEARRQVVAQIVDYAQALSGWRYEELEKAAMRCLAEQERRPEWSLYDWATTYPGDGDGRLGEQEFVDAVSRHLEEGRFLLLIAGDGIRRDLESLVGFLQRTPQLHFTLAVVELAVYALPDGEHLIVPRTTAKTAEITRATVQVEAKSDVPADKLAIYVNVETPRPEGEGGLTEAEYRRRCEEEGTWWIHEKVRAAAREMGMKIAPTDRGYSLFARKPDGDEVPAFWAKVSSVQLPLWRMWPHDVSSGVTDGYRAAVERVIPLSQVENEPWGRFPDGFDEASLDQLVNALRQLAGQLD